MYAKIEPSGCCVSNGMCQVRFDLYLDTSDYEYDRCYVKPKGESDFHLNPFHILPMFLEPDTPDSVILELVQAYLEQAYILWACEEPIILQSHSKTRLWNDMTLADELANLDIEHSEKDADLVVAINDRIALCEARAEAIKKLTDIVRIN